ncbi:MAG: response regulator [Candidatus Omnitrophica bacterium]|nr:response regulator [Candidatus Omnitrophota bacterium]
MGYRLLIVDDEKDMVEVLERRCLKEGYLVSVAFDGQEALAKVEADNPDVILLDLMLPKLSGIEVLREVRQRYHSKWIPVIIISAKNELGSLKDCYNLEADHYLTKPCTIDKVLTGIETMLSLIPLRKNE